MPEREKHRPEKTAEETAYYGDTALPYRYDIDEFVPAFQSVVSEIFVESRKNVQKTRKHYRKRNEPKEQFHRIVCGYTDFL